MHQSSSFFYDSEAGKLNTTGSNAANILLYLATVAGTFLAENWYLAIMVIFGGIHAYAAWRKHRREEIEADYKRRDRELLIDREEERQRLADEIIKKNEQRAIDAAYTVELERARNRDHSNTRADLYLDHPEKRRSPLKSIGSDK